jgi:hypothetical protein
MSAHELNELVEVAVFGKLEFGAITASAGRSE